MNNQEAKLILQGYRLGGQDALNPAFAEALEQVRRDPELQKWFAAERILDEKVQVKLQKAIVVPMRLKGSLLAQRKISRPKVWWLQPAWLIPATASLVLLIVFSAYWLKQSNAPQFADLRGTMVQNSLQMEGHVSLMVQDMTKIRDWLKTQNAPANFALPAALHDAVLHGCKIVDWHGQKVTMLCLMSGSSHMDLFMIDCAHFPDFKPSEAIQFAKGNGLTTAVWCNGDKTYLLAGKMDESELKKIL